VAVGVVFGGEWVCGFEGGLIDAGSVMLCATCISNPHSRCPSSSPPSYPLLLTPHPHSPHSPHPHPFNQGEAALFEDIKAKGEDGNTTFTTAARVVSDHTHVLALDIR